MVEETEIHAADHIYHFLVNHIDYPTPDDARREYFRNGQESAARLRSILGDLQISPLSLLEFASGYGCVTRHLRDALPGTSIVSCDIHEAAIEFIRSQFALNGILSDRVPERAELGGPYDVTFALSFFSHMPKASWARWLVRLLDATKPTGMLIFTTHGMRSAEMMKVEKFDDDGFWFVPNSEQADLSTDDYGTTITAPGFVMGLIERLPAALVLFREAAWWGHQDLFVLRRL